MHKNSPLFLNIAPNLFIMLGLPKAPTWRNADRPRKPKKGLIGFNSQTSSLEYWSGSYWFAAAMTKG